MLSNDIKNKLMLFAHQWVTPFFCAGLWFFGYWLVKSLYVNPSPIIQVAWIFIVFFLEIVVTFFDMFFEHPNASIRARILIPIAVVMLFVAIVVGGLFHVNEMMLNSENGENDMNEIIGLLLTILFGVASLIKFMQVWLPNNFHSHVVDVEISRNGGDYKRHFPA